LESYIEGKLFGKSIDEIDDLKIYFDETIEDLVKYLQTHEIKFDLEFEMKNCLGH